MDEKTSPNYKNYYRIEDIIGNGASGCIFKGVKIKTKELRAIKIITLNTIKANLIGFDDIEKAYNDYINGLIQEVNIMKVCSNINSMKYYEFFNDGNNFVIIMELCDENLSQLLSRHKKGFYDKEIYEIMKQLNNAFKIMRQNNIIHRDLKLDNILIKYDDNNNYIIKLSDYGCSKRLNSLGSKIYFKSHVGTATYMAPEILKEEDYNYKCDLWSIGIIIYILKFGKPPFNGCTEKALIESINNFNINSIKTGNNELDDLIKKLLEKNKENRLNWDNYFNHPFFK